MLLRLSRFALLVGVLALCALLFGAGLPGAVIPAAAEEKNACQLLVEETMSAAKAACDDVGPDSACYGHAGATFTGEDMPALNTGMKITLNSLQSLTTSAANTTAGEWGIAVMNLSLGLPEASGGVRAILFGDSVLNNAVLPNAASLPTLPVKTFDELPVTLRAGATTSFPQVIRFTAGTPAVADGRNAKATWLRIRIGEAVGWTALSQVRLDGDINTLTELSDTDIAPSWLYSAPMQAVKLSSTVADKPVCNEASAGLLLNAKLPPDSAPARLLVNGAAVAFTEGVIVLRATASDHLEVMAISGAAKVTAYGVTGEVAAGEMLRVRLGGKDGLTAVAAPKETTKMPFAALEGAPLAMLPDTLACQGGVIATDARAAVRSGPSAKDFTSLFFLQPKQIYNVVGWNQDADGGKWWKIANDKNAENWVEQAAIRVIGACEVLPKVEPGTFSAGGGSAGEPDNGIPGGGGFAPAAKSIWNAEVGLDQLVGTCKLGALNYCSHLVAISPRGSGLTYKGMEIKAYPLSRAQENVYVYNGRNGVGNGQIKIELTFTSPTSYTMTQTIVFDEDPQCQHINVVNATIR